MREKLLSGVKRLCAMFPPLVSNIKYSEVLSQKQVDVFSAFATGKVDQVFSQFYGDDKEIFSQISALLEGSTGISIIRNSDVLHVGALLSAAASNDGSVPPEVRDVVDFLRDNRDIWWNLHNAYESIVKNDVVGTCPIAIARPWSSHFPLGRQWNDFNEFHKLFHESIHFVLEENGLCSGDEDFDEGIVTYLHEEVMGRAICKIHYSSGDGVRYLRLASELREIIHNRPRSDIIPFLKGFIEQHSPEEEPSFLPSD